MNGIDIAAGVTAVVNVSEELGEFTGENRRTTTCDKK
jgi:hypothetical protein